MLTRGRRRSRPRGTRGFTDAEVLVRSAPSLMVLGSVYSFQLAQMRAFATQAVYTQSQNITRNVIDLMTRELRMASFDPTSTQTVAGAIPKAPTGAGVCAPNTTRGIVEATPTRIHFQQDLDGNGAIGAAGEDVTYTLVGDTLQRQDGANAPVDIVSGIPAGGFTLLYFDGNNPPGQLGPGATLTQCQRDSLAKIRITVRANLVNPNPHAPAVKSLAESEIAVRSRSTF